jgi:MSHA biogenesis protein MshJ
MKTKQAQLFAKVDALSLRERAIVFVTVLACVGAFVNYLWLEPALELGKKLQQQSALQSAELQRLRGEVQTASVAVDPSKPVRDDLTQMQMRMDEVNGELRRLLPTAQSQQPLEQVLVQFLHRYEGLTLLSVKTLTDVGSKVDAVGLTKRGLELRVSGPYAALVGYVQKLESALPSLRWGSMALKSEAQPPELILQVYVLGVLP